jgi:tetratricopeptide (TPR) repeat protein
MNPEERALRDACEFPNAGSKAHLDLGQLLYEQEKWAEAEVAFLRSSAIDPKAWTAHQIGVCLHNQEQFEEAEKFYLLALELGDETLDTTHENFYTNFGICVFSQGRYEESLDLFKKANGFKARYYHADSLFKITRLAEAEKELQSLVLAHVSMNESDAEKVNETIGSVFNLLGLLRLQNGDRRPFDALLMFHEALRHAPNKQGIWSNRARMEEELGQKKSAQKSLESAIRLDSENESYKKRLQDLLVETPVPYYESFEEYLADGKLYLRAAKWTNASQSRLLTEHFRAGGMWWNPEIGHLFDDYHVSEEFLDESLARAESVAKHLHLEVEFPIRLNTGGETVSIERDGNMLRVIVGSGASVAVSINLETWDLHYLPKDQDSIFAVGFALNFFLDCGVNLSKNPKFAMDSLPDSLNPTNASTGSSWLTTVEFDESVSNIRLKAAPQPPNAHRVRGFIRTLSLGIPSDDALSHAPSYIRRNMRPGQTFVRPHQRGGDAARDLLLRRLQTHSSLADFLATAPRRIK